MSDANRCASNRGYVTILNVAVSLLEVDPVVISQFCFHHHIVMDAVTEPSAPAETVGVSLRNAEVVKKHANFDALLCEGRTAAQQKSDTDDSEPSHPKAPK